MRDSVQLKYLSNTFHDKYNLKKDLNSAFKIKLVDDLKKSL